MRVSVIIPCWNEVAFIERVLTSIVDGEHGDFDIEVLVIDGMSKDGTREIVQRLARSHPQIRLLDNHERKVSQALNLGIRESRGDVVVRMDAHAEYPAEYVRTLVTALIESGADNVGGVWLILPGADTLQARVVAIASAHPIGVGNARYRIGVAEKCEVDTVPFGCYRRDVFERIGLFDTDMVRNQDDELNARLKAHGGRILLLPSVVIRYFARPTIRQIETMFFQYGYFKPLGNIKAGRVTTLRQLAPPALVVSAACSLLLMLAFPPAAPWLLGGGSLYPVLVGLVAIREARKHRLGLKGAALLTVCLVRMHLAYGAGFLRGWADFRLRRLHSKRVLSASSTR